MPLTRRMAARTTLVYVSVTAVVYSVLCFHGECVCVCVREREREREKERERESRRESE